jgi:hypothetical protein
VPAILPKLNEGVGALIEPENGGVSTRCTWSMLLDIWVGGWARTNCLH